MDLSPRIGPVIIFLVFFVFFWGISVTPLRAEQILHEPLLNPNEEYGPLIEQPGYGMNPTALRVLDREIFEPDHLNELRSGEQSFQPGRFNDANPNSPNIENFRPDLLTDQVSENLYYHSTFSPSIAPYKRVTALDRVGDDYVLSLASPERENVGVGGDPDEFNDIFWGSVLVQFVPNQPIKIPSIAPESRILSYRTRPEIPIEFSRDGAGNYFVVSSQAGQSRLIFVTDTPSTYFGASLPSHIRARDVPPNLRPRLPETIKRATKRVFRHLGLNPHAPISRNLSRLILYLRSFETEPLEDSDQEDRYVSLALGRKGVCRHRAFVFVVTAQGLGLPARFVSNEVHAFSEVFIPTLGWIRIDLGGEALRSPESEPHPYHQPRLPDPFPWPSEGHFSVSSLRNKTKNVDEPMSPLKSSKVTHPGQDTLSTNNSKSQAMEIQTVQEFTKEFSTDLPDAQTSRILSTPFVVNAVVLDSHPTSVVRGEIVQISGGVQGEEGWVRNAGITLWLKNSLTGEMVWLGHVNSGSTGRFQSQFVVSSTISTGNYILMGQTDY